ncbi:MAG TPA: hypothetical protein G4N92_06145 [Anaerolineae bacterium]|nr:hypothetical protein [Anaerolineae bacterium]
MSEKSKTAPDAELDQIIASAKRLGIELDEAEALQWLTAIAVAQQDEDIAMDIKSGVFGHKVTMLDFSDAELAHFRKIGALVGFEDQPGVVETALALSGSAAQSKIQKYPGDADYFERVNIKADSKEDACCILAKIMHAKVRDTLKGPTYQLIEVKLGSYPEDVIRGERSLKKGSPIAWKAQEALDGKQEVNTADGKALVIEWEDAAQDPGWCKLDWVVAHPVHKHLVNASNMLDVTWEAPDGNITPLDGYLDPYFQEVYLEAESIPVFTKLAKHVSSDALDDYVQALEREVKKYLTGQPNYGKAAKRMYNIFRLTGRYIEAAFVRELFDEPATVLYQVWSLIRTIDDCCQPGTSITKEQMLNHADDLITMVVKELEGEEEVEIVRLLLRLRDFLSRQEPGQELSPQTEAARAELINIVNNFFYEKLTAVPVIEQYMQEIAKV